MKEYLVPELCEFVRFPTVYWLKAMVLPSVLHRVNQLLIAEQLRDQIARDIGMSIREHTRDTAKEMFGQMGKLIINGKFQL